MRIALLMAVTVGMVKGCMPGFYGDDCSPCSENYWCNGTSRNVCPLGSTSFRGSRNCFSPLHRNISVALLPVVNWWANLGRNPSNETCGCFRMVQPLTVILDVGRNTSVAGIVTRRDRSGVWLKSYMIDYSVDNESWSGVGGIYVGNNEVDAAVTNLFPHLVQARYFRVQIIEYFLWPGFRAAFLEAIRSRCARRINQIVINEANCTYICKKGTFPINVSTCVARASISASSPQSFNVQIAARHARLNSKLHKFQRGYAVEFKEPWNGSEIALKIDDRPWIAWSRHSIVLSMEEYTAVGANSSFLLLPQIVNVSVRLRILWQSRLLDVALHDCIVHGRRNTSVKAQSIQWSWGSDGAMLGDLSALVSITCEGNIVDAEYGLHDSLVAMQNVLTPTVVHDVARSCATNVSHGIVWLREATELLGVDPLLGDFVRDECRKGVTAWVLPRGPRRGLKYAKVQVTCQFLTKN
jgi:hypothetical protein